MRGTVIYYQGHYGFIENSKGGKDIFFHKMNVLEPVDRGDIVEFETTTCDRGTKGINIRKIKPDT